MAFGLYDLAQNKLAHIFSTHAEAEAQRIAADVKTLVHVHVDETTGETTETPENPKPAQEEVAVTPVAPATEPVAEPTAETPAVETPEAPVASE